MDRYAGEYTPSTSFIAKDGVRTFGYDNNLPPLPVPPLEQTLAKYLESVRPHLNPTEYQQTEVLVEDFANKDGANLHKMLVERAKTHKNWLEEWWLSYAYLKWRVPISPLTNVCGIGPYFNHIWPPTPGTQVPRAALATYYHLQQWQLLRKERLAPDSGKAGKEPWSMNQFRKLHNCCRTPGLEEDVIHEYFKTESEGSVPTHIAVFCNRRIYRLETMSSDGSLYTPPELEASLAKIKSEAYNKGPGIGLASMTGAERTSWYHIRERLIRLSSKNLDNLETIQTSVCTVALINKSPSGSTQLAREGLLGEPGNVWFDKSYNALWFENGVTVSNCDHAPMDAMTSVGTCYYIDCRLKECQGVWQGSTKLRETPAYRELEFTVDDAVLKAINNAEKEYVKLTRNVEIINPEFGVFGKQLLRKYNIHPDTFVQVCLQYAYYKLHGKPAPTYETATTRKFYNGRTETVKSCTNEALMFSKAMLDPDAKKSYKLSLFKQAMDKHLSLMRECMSGQGVDRHLLGLKIIALENNLPLPALFTDPAFEKSGGNGNYILSTSFIGFTSVHGGVTPMCKDGYGCFYRMGAHRMVFFLSSWLSDEGTSAVKLFDGLKAAMIEAMSLVESQSNSNL